MKLKAAFLVLLAIVATLVAQEPERQIRLDDLYSKAVRDASVAQEGEIARDLVQVTPHNKQLVWNENGSRILVVTWKSRDAFERFFASSNRTSDDQRFVVWVTAAPQLQDFCRSWTETHPKAATDDLELRLKQYLGLFHEWEYDVFVELWVRPEALFRPCVDPETNDSECRLQCESPPPTVRNVPDYPTFYKNLYFQDFRAEPGVPWTGLGYTYDWGNPLTEQGASEFILIPGAQFELKDAIPTADYCARR